MPAEAQRLQRRLHRRDRLVIATVLAATGVTIAGALFVSDNDANRGSAQCVTYDDAGVLGGGTWHLCGIAALRYCRQQPKPKTAVQCATLLRPRQNADP